MSDQPLQGEWKHVQGSISSTGKLLSNYWWLARETLKALAQADLDGPCLRVALWILQWSYLRNRNAAHFEEQADIAALDGRMDDTAVGKAVKKLESLHIIERIGRVRIGRVLCFRPHSEWRVALRSKEGARARQSDVERKLCGLAEQLGLNLLELNNQLQEEFLRSGPVVPDTTRTVPGTTGPVVPDTTRTVPGTTGPSTYNNVGNQRRSNAFNVERSSREEIYLDCVRQFFDTWDPNRASDEMANSGGWYRKLIRLGHGPVLERTVNSIAELAKTGRKPTETWPQWLMDELRRCMGQAEWERSRQTQMPK